MLKDKKLWIIILCCGLSTTGFGISIPFFALYLSNYRNVSMSLTGTFLAVAMLSTTISQALGGELSDIWGRKKVMLSSLFGSTVATILMALAIYTNADYGWLVVLYFLDYFVLSFFMPAGMAWVADNVGFNDRMRAFGLFRIGMNAGWAVGPAIGGFLTNRSYSLAFFATSIAYFLGALAVLFFIDKSSHLKHRSEINIKEMIMVLKNKKFAALCFYSMLIFTVSTQLVVGLSLFCSRYLGFSEKSIGTLFSINGVVVILFQYHMSKFLTKFKITLGVALGCLVTAVGYLVIGYSNIFIWIAVGVLIFSVGELMVSPGTGTLAVNMSCDATKGRYLGMYSMTHRAGYALGMFLGGITMSEIAPFWRAGPWWIIAIIALIAMFGFLNLRKSLTNTEDGLKPEKLLTKYAETADALDKSELI